MIKTLASHATAVFNTKCRYDRAIFILGHMRFGSTALSNILCSHQHISGYGEAHISYEGNASLGLLALNQTKRRAYKQAAQYLFDKILHSRYDSDIPASFYDSRAIFMLREPTQTIASIRNLFSTLNSEEYSNNFIISDYYEERICSLLLKWENFPKNNRYGVSFQQLISNPEKHINDISGLIALTPPLENRYSPPKNKLGHGAGDPINSHKYNKIVAQDVSTSSVDDRQSVDLPESRISELVNLYTQALQIVTQV